MPCFSLFQTLGQWGRSKKRAQDEQDLVKKIGEGALSYQCPRLGLEPGKSSLTTRPPRLHRLNVTWFFNRCCLWRCCRCCLNCFCFLRSERLSALSTICLFGCLACVWEFVCLALVCLFISLPFIQFLLFVQGIFVSYLNSY